MIIPVKYIWEQLDGPQVSALEEATFQYFKQLLDPKLDYFNTLNVATANDEHLTFLGILANFVRPVITVPDREFFYLTADVEHDNTKGFSSLENRKVGGRLTGIEGATTEARPLSTEHYRTLLKAYINNEGKIGGLKLLDDICYELSKLDQPTVDPFYRFEFMSGDNIPAGRAPGDVYIDIGNLSNWNNPMQIYAVLRGLANSAYWPVPALFISISTQVVVPEPSITLESGTYEGTQSGTVHCEIESAIIYYTLDGSDPTLNSLFIRVGGTITIDKSCTLTMKAVTPNYINSPLVSYNYIIT